MVSSHSLTRDIAVAGRLLRVGGVLALLFGLVLWAGLVSYALFGALWQSGQKTEAFFAVAGREIRDLDVFAEKARNLAASVQSGVQRQNDRTRLLADRVREPLLAMASGTARAIEGVAWDADFELVKLGDLAPAEVDLLAGITARLMLLDEDFWSPADAEDETFLITPDGRFAAYRPLHGRDAQPVAVLAAQSQALLAELRKVERYPAASGESANHPIWTRNYIHPVTGVLTVTSFVPIRDAAGRVILYVGTSMSPNMIVPQRMRHLDRDGESVQLVSEDGLVIASSGPPLPPVESMGTLLTMRVFGGSKLHLRVDSQRVVFERHLPANPWSVRYAVENSRLLRENAPMLAGATLLLALYAGGVFAAMRHLRQRIIEPAQQRTAALIERDAFTQTLIETAPVGMAIIDPFQPAMVMSSPAYAGTVDLLRQLGEGELSRVYRQLNSGVVARPVRRLLSVTDAAGERHYTVNLVDTVFRERPVLIGTVSDVTEQRRFELEQRKARLAAESANKAKDAFLTTVSHEMRTPLYGTLASLELLSGQKLDEEQRYYVDVMESSTRNLLDLINDLLDYSRIQVGRFELNPRDCLLVKELESVGLSFTGRARLQGLTLDWMIDPALTRAVHTDALRLGQVVTNLVGNAVKFTPQGHVAFSARVQHADAQGCQVEFRVTDSGVGIAESDLPELFRAFGKSTTEPGMQQGTGLGLAISHQFVSMLGGMLDVSSQRHEGTTMSFTLDLPWAADSHDFAPIEPRGTFGWVSGVERRGWYLNALLRHAGFTPVRHAEAVAWSAGEGREQDAGLLMFADEWPVRGMTVDDVYLLRTAPVAAAAGPWPRNVPMLHQSDVWSALDAPPSVRGVGVADDAGNGRGEPVAEPLAGWYVLLADDHPISGMLLTRQLERLGAVVDCYHDAREALAAFDEASHMLVMTDANMPHMNGAELATRIRQACTTVPIVVVTADVTLRVDPKDDSPFDAAVYKPVEAGVLNRVIESLRGRYPLLGVHVEPLMPVADADAGPPGTVTPTLGGVGGDLPSRDLIATFIAVTEQDIARCREACKGDVLDRLVLQHCAHRLRGGCMSMGMPCIADLAAQLEHRAPQASPAQIADAFHALDAAWNDWLRMQGHAVAL